MNELIYESNLMVLAKDMAKTKPNEKGEVREYCKLTLFDRPNRVTINVNCYSLDKYEYLIEGELVDVKLRVTAKDNKLDFYMI